MSLTPLFTDSDLEKMFRTFADNAELVIHEMLQAAGEKFVEYARESGNYKDRTGNLRSSIGYIIVSDGVTMNSNFQKSEKGTDGDAGVENGGRIAREVAQSYKNGMILIGVAGMDYALAVEAIDGIDVITGGSIQAEQWLQDAIKSVL